MLRSRLPWLPLRAPLDLHALDTPPAFILSQDQTLKFVEMFLVSNTALHFPSALSQRERWEECEWN